MALTLYLIMGVAMWSMVISRGYNTDRRMTKFNLIMLPFVLLLWPILVLFYLLD